LVQRIKEGKEELKKYGFFDEDVTDVEVEDAGSEMGGSEPGASTNSD
jgi:hypothetical protein